MEEKKIVNKERWIFLDIKFKTFFLIYLEINEKNKFP